LTPLSAFLLFASGGVAGLFGALLGVGGGVLIVPLLHLAFGFPLPVAVGTSLVAITGTSLAGSAGYLGRKLVHLDVALGLSMGALAGALVSSWLASSLPEVAIARLFSVTLLGTALYLAWKSRQSEGEERPASGGRRLAAYLMSPLAGGASGLLGIGGGLVQVPILRLLLGLSMRRAVAISTLMVGWNASVSAAIYLRRGEVDLPTVPWLLLGVLCGALGAPALGGKLPQRALEIGFSLVLIYGALRMFR
jgi:uncharacterized membrane protein YfcA